MKPFAVELYERSQNGETPEALAAELGIPIERIMQRIRTAGEFLPRKKDCSEGRVNSGLNACPQASQVPGPKAAHKLSPGIHVNYGKERLFYVFP